MTGKINCHRKKIKKRTRIKPYLSKNPLIWRDLSGKKAKISLEPSRGGMGTRLKIARRILMKTIRDTISIKAGLVSLAIPTRNNKPNKSARKILEAGPAEATIASDHLPGLRL